MESHGYVLYTDPQTGHPYYYNSVTGDSKWAEDADAAGAAQQAMKKTLNTVR